MKTPDFLIAGFPRSGTSSLHDYLGQHPDIFMAAIKEPNFFATDFHQESDRFHGKRLYFPYRSEQKYLRLFAGRGRGQLAGEASWTNLYSVVAGAKIQAYNPLARIVIVFREPVAFLFSYHSAATFALGEDIPDIRNAIAAEKERRRGERLGKRVIVPSWLYYSRFIRYSEHIGRYLTLFGKEKVKIVVFDDLIEKTETVYREIAAFLGVDTKFRPDFSVVNANKVLKWPRLKKAVLDSPYFRKFLRLLVSDNGYAGMKRFYKNRIVTYQKREPIPEDVRRELMLMCREEVEKLSALLDRDFIRLWGYDAI